LLYVKVAKYKMHPHPCKNQLKISLYTKVFPMSHILTPAIPTHDEIYGSMFFIRRDKHSVVASPLLLFSSYFLLCTAPAEGRNNSKKIDVRRRRTEMEIWRGLHDVS
jgi:hypothetical protein